ncbi:hypothetical protein T01_4294 [Trichinella spiralis]|uniref:Uncharacterized protein n=1 Tax=Trichinella spiralis TaxID=6334 RepID=A0A0V1AVL0_TRISP|nr:hypothetical protein T01_4294 [Trichinella spiralis]
MYHGCHFEKCRTGIKLNDGFRLACTTTSML